MTNPCRMSLMDMEMFLNHGDETQERSLKDPWELNGDLLFDPQVLLDTIMMKGGTLAPLYANAATFYRMNNAWWNRHKLTFQKWWEVIDDEYTPLWDRDGFEETIDKTTDDGSTTGNTTSTEVMDDDTSKHSTTKEVMDDDTTLSETGKETFDSTDKRTISNTEVIDDNSTSNTTTSSTADTATSNNSTTNNFRSAFDSGYDAKGNPIYQPHDCSKTVESGSSETTSSVNSNTTATDDRTTTTNGTDNLKSDSKKDTTKNTTGTDDRTTDTTYNETGTDDRTTTFNENTAGTSENTRDYTHEHHSWGNWGITTTAQKLLEQELRIRAFDIYDHMADFFLDELCVRVYL